MLAIDQCKGKKIFARFTISA